MSTRHEFNILITYFRIKLSNKNKTGMNEKHVYVWLNQKKFFAEETISLSKVHILGINMTLFWTFTQLK